MATPAKKKTTLAERTTLAKILTVLGRSNSQSRQIKTTEDLVREIERSKPVAFTYLRAHAGRPSGTAMCTRRLMRERVRLCVDLQLVDNKGQLTKIGTAALGAARPGRQVAVQAVSFLRAKDFDVDKELSVRLGHDGRFPTAAELYTDRIALKNGEFRRLLNLLVHCEYLHAVQSRMYFLSKGT